MKFCLNIEFGSREELDDYLKEMDAFQQWKEKRTLKRQNDGRGKKTQLLHQFAKAISLEKNIPYRESLKLAGLKVKELSKVD